MTLTNLERQIKETELFLFDMDGTLYLGDRLFDFSRELLDEIRKQGKKYLFLTNNSSKSVIDYVKKLEKLGIEATEDDFMTSSGATAYYLKKKLPNAVLYVCGTQSLKDELKRNGFEIREEMADDITAVLMGFDTELTFKKLHDVSYLLTTRPSLDYIATNPDLVCPTEFGSVPDCGSVCEMIFNSTGRRPIVIGKPSPLMPQLAMDKEGSDPAHTALVGDRIYTDIKSALNAGAAGYLVMSGETTYEILEKSEDKPTAVFESGADILEILKKGE